MLEWLFGKKKQEEPKPQSNKPKQSVAQQEAEDKWKYEFLIQFLSGPVWKVSILDFVDYHCVVFDNEEENKFEYTIIHNKFKELVATLFDGMVQQVGLDDQKLAELLEKGFQSKHKKIFNQLLLADDFVRFKTLMVNRNKSLQAQAVKSLTQKDTVQKKSYIEKKNPGKVSEAEVLRESQRIEQQRKRKLEEQEEEQLRKVLQISRIEAQEEKMIKELQKKAQIAEKQKIEEAPKTQIKEPSKHEIKESSVVKSSEPETIQQPIIKIEEVPQIKSTAQPKVKKNLPSLQPLPALRGTKKHQEPVKVQQPPQVVQQTKVVEEKVEQPAQKSQLQSQQERRKRLLQQRERIRRKKEQQRKKQAAEQQTNPVQTIVLQQDGIHQTHHQEEKKDKVSQQQIERRKALMQKIKNRIVDDF